MRRPIDNVTTDNLQDVLGVLGISVDVKILDIIIDAIEVLELKGDHISLDDIYEIKKNHYSM